MLYKDRLKKEKRKKKKRIKNLPKRCPKRQANSGADEATALKRLYTRCEARGPKQES